MSPAPADARRLLERAAALAAGAALDVLPDPPVGCLLVSARGAVVGEGSHLGHGLLHAEAGALAAAGPRARGTTAFVTLEPCGPSGAGKRTSPCAGALVRAGVKAVVYAAEDPTPHASGAGPRALREAGVAVRRVRSAAAESTLSRWRGSLADPLPWTIAKWAMTLDGKIADARGASRWISGEESRARVQEMRALCDAVVVGSRTALLDDPDLRPRPVRGSGGRVPLRVVVDGELRLPLGSRLASTAREAPVLVATGSRAPPVRRAALLAAGVEVAVLAGEEGRVDLRALFRALRARGARRVLLEGGGDLHAAALRAGVVRQAAVFVSPAILGGRTAPSPVGGAEGLRAAADPLRLEEVRVSRPGGDLLLEGFLPA